MNDENLKPYQFTSGKVARENGRKGGLQKAKNEKERKTIRETLQILIGMPCQHEKIREAIKKEGIPDEAITNGVSVAYATIVNAHKKADWARVLFEMLCENDVQGVSKIPGALQVNFSSNPEDFKK